MDISRKTYELLKISGWHPGRRIDCTGTVEFLKDRGFSLNARIVFFLEQFGNLEFNLINAQDDSEINRHHTQVKKTIGSLNVKDFKYFEEAFGEKVIPVGELFNRHMYLFVSENGNIYCDLGLLGKDYMIAFQNLFNSFVQSQIGQINVGKITQENHNIICVVTDKSTPDIIYAIPEDNGEGNFGLDEEDDRVIQYAAFSGIFGPNSSIKPERELARVEEYKNYSRFCLTDGWIDRCLTENAWLLRGKDVERIRQELFKLRDGINRVKKDARLKDERACDGSNSFEMWPVEYCAEIWAARNAILNGVRFENIAFSLIRRSDKGILNMCGNCRRIFEDNYKVRF